MDKDVGRATRHSGPPLEVVIDRVTMRPIAERSRTPDRAVVSQGAESIQGDAAIPHDERPSHPVAGVSAGSVMTLSFMLALATLPIFAVSVFVAVPIMVVLVAISAAWSMTKRGPEH
jgi:hypothetical protein